MELAMIQNGVYYYVCLVCYTSPQQHCGVDASPPPTPPVPPSEFVTTCPPTGHPCPFSFPYPLILYQPRFTTTGAQLNHHSQRWNKKKGQYLGLPKYLTYDPGDDFQSVAGDVTILETYRTVWYTDNQGTQRKARLFEVRAGTLDLWCIGQEMKNTKDSPAGEHQGNVQAVANDSTPYYHRLKVERSEDNQVFYYDVVLYQR